MAIMRVADYIVDCLAELGARHVFMVTGGGAMHLNDAFGRSKTLTKVCMHHEQACAMAAESYCRLSRVPAIVNVTTGPGGINALNGVFGAYTDSIGMIVVSGQVKRETMASRYPALALRQLGDQEVDIVAMAAPVTKFAVVLDDARRVRAIVELAWFIAVSGRPGPVWIDVPIDVQASVIDVDTLDGFDQNAWQTGGSLPALPDSAHLPANTLAERDVPTTAELRSSLGLIVDRLRAARRPIVLVGSGVRISGSLDLLRELLASTGLGVVTGWNAHDAIENAHPSFIGRPGTVGDRAGNFAVQSADFLLILGCRMNIRQVSYNWASLAPHAWKAMIDIDAAELHKPTLAIDCPVVADLHDALGELVSLLRGCASNPAHAAYVAWCRERTERYPTVLPAYRPSSASADDPINPYYFVSSLFDALDGDDIVVTGDGTACVVTFQAARLRPDQRLYTNSGSASMGYDLPAAIGAHFAAGGRRVVCIAGDGSLMMNLQELQTIAGLRLPIKIFVINNGGYHSIRQTQDAYFPDNEVGVGPGSGLTFPDFPRLAEAFGFVSSRVSSTRTLDLTLRAALDRAGPTFCEIVVDQAQGFAPKLQSRRLDDGSMVSPELDDMFPFLDRGELEANRLI